MGTPGGQMPKFGEKRTPNYRYYANNTKSPHDCIQYKAWWDLFKLNGKIVGPLYDHLGEGVNIQIYTKNDPKQWYYANNFTIWTIWSFKVITKIHSGQSMIGFLQNNDKTVGLTLYMITSAVKCSNFDQKLHQILVLRKELHNLNHLISSHKNDHDKAWWYFFSQN